MKKTLIIFASSLITIISCSKDDEPASGSNDCATTPASFAADVNPIIQPTCATNASCHGSGSINGPGPLLTYNQIFSARNSIKSSVANRTMPKNGSLSASQRASIICWVDNGAPNN